MSKKAMQQALEVLQNLQGGCTDSGDGTVEAITVWCPEVIEALEQALAEPEPRNQCGETCERAKLCAICTKSIAEHEQDELRRLHTDNEGLYHTVAAQAKQIIELVEALRMSRDALNQMWQSDKARPALVVAERALAKAGVSNGS